MEPSFTDYWDIVIRQWLAGEVDEYQQAFFGNKGEFGLSFDDLPEPYWGDPQDSSFVIVNYNPGGGFNRDRHTYRDCAGCPKSIVTYVQQKGYSTLARESPLLMSEAELKEKDMSWVMEYDGWDWWQKKQHWIEQIESAAAEAKGQKATVRKKPPFVFELCAWHSKNFNDKCMNVLLNDAFLKKQFSETLRETVRQSDLKLAVCVGAKFNGLLGKIGFTTVDSVGQPQTNGKERRFQMYWCDDISAEAGRIVVTWIPSSRNRYQQFSEKELIALKSILKHNQEKL